MRTFQILNKPFIFPTDVNDQPPQIVLICGPCRGGTTALANTFVVAGVEAHMQPMKSIAREQALGGDTIPQVQFHNPELVLTKETFGASGTFELFNPVQMLVEAGYPAHLIKVVGMVREPVAAMDSWHRLWNTVNEEIFLSAYVLMTQIQAYCQRSGVAYLPYTPEIIRDNRPEIVLEQVTSHLRIPLPAHEMCDWHGKPPFGDDQESWPNLYFYDAPPTRFIEGVRTRGGYVFSDTTKTRYEVPERTIEIYHDHLRGCESALGLRV